MNRAVEERISQFFGELAENYSGNAEAFEEPAVGFAEKAIDDVVQNGDFNTNESWQKLETALQRYRQMFEMAGGLK